MTDTSIEPPWYAAYPVPSNSQVDVIKREDLLDRLQNGQKAGVDFLLVDLRRTDHMGGTIQRSLNVPAQTVFESIPTLYELCQRARIPLVIWYCGSSRGRGTRAAGWFEDFIKAQLDLQMKSVILLGGIRGWATAGKEYQEYMVGYDAGHWQESDSTQQVSQV